MKTILFDIDHTLCNSRSLFADYIVPAIAEAIGQESSKVLASFHQYRTSVPRTSFDPWQLIDALATEFGADRSELEAIVFTESFYKQTLYPEVVPVLKQLQQTHTLGAYTEAVIPWQQRKLALSGLINYFDPELVFISRDKKASELIERLPSSTIIDDNTEYLYILEKRLDLAVVWLNRETKEKHQHFATVHNLEEFEQLLKK